MGLRITRNSTYMKQHITKEQWDELSEEQQGQFYILGSYKKEFRYEYVTIGQMIEFLGDDLEDMTYISNDAGKGECTWLVNLEDKDNPLEPEQFLNEELADALWEATKFKYKLNERSTN